MRAGSSEILSTFIARLPNVHGQSSSPGASPALPPALRLSPAHVHVLPGWCLVPAPAAVRGVREGGGLGRAEVGGHDAASSNSVGKPISASSRERLSTAVRQ